MISEYDVVAEHYSLHIRTEYLEYIEQFYLRKLLSGAISLSSVWHKLQDVPFSDRAIKHMFNHIKYLLEKRVIGRERERTVTLKLSYKRKQKLSYVRVRTGLTKREVYSKRRAWMRDKLNRVHHIDTRTGRFVKVPKHLKVRKKA